MLANLKTSRKLGLGFVIVIAVLLIMAAGIGTAVQRLSAASARNNMSNAAEIALNKVTEQIYRGDRAILAFAISGDDRYMVAGKSALGEIVQDLDAAAKELPADRPDLQAMVAKARTSSENWLAKFGRPRIQDLTASDGRKRIEASFAAGRDATTDTLHAVQDAQAAVAKWSDEESEREVAATHALLTTLITGTVFAVLLSILAGWVITRSITRPIGTMLDAMGRLASGETGITVPALQRRDEIGDIGRAVQVFKEAALDKLRIEGEADTQRRMVEGERRQTETERQHTAQQQDRMVGALASGLSRLAQGDLTYSLDEPFAPEYEQLRRDFNTAIGELRQLIGTIVGNAATIRSGTSEISQASQDLSRRTEQQAASLEETAAALDEITATVRQTSEGAQHARQVVATAKTDAERSGQVVQQAVAAMSEIETSSNQIGQIIGVIDEIAFQTNLLALNAGVEAARAGEAGKGFAVVASEVRALAQRSAEAAKEIKSLIQSSADQVASGVELVGETGKALTRIVDQVSEISRIVGTIAASASEQATGLNEVNTAVNQMDQTTQQNAAMVEQTTAASGSLASEAEQLQALVDRFEIGRRTASSAAAVRLKPAAAPMRSAAPRTQGALALKAEPEVGWEEF
jgi:methyl-accepting chemotaxis protein